MTVYVKKKGNFGKTLKKDVIAALLAAATMSGGMVLVVPVSATANYGVGKIAPLASTDQQIKTFCEAFAYGRCGFFIAYWLYGGLLNPDNSVPNFYRDFHALTEVDKQYVLDYIDAHFDEIPGMTNYIRWKLQKY